MKNNNPYHSLNWLMQERGAVWNAPDMQIGTVKSIDPLAVYGGGTELTQNLYVPPNLLDDTEFPEIPAVSCGQSGAGAQLSKQIQKIREFWVKYLERERLEEGDTVVLKRIGEENVILGKVVEAE